MLFNSVEFLLYLPVVFMLYWFVFKQLRLQNIFVVLASYVFYGWWDWRFLGLIVFTSTCSYASGLLMHRFSSFCKTICTTNIIINLGILLAFKYFNFFSESLSMLAHTLGIGIDFVTINLILPVGISFYTFQALSYTIDVYRGDVKPTTNLPAFFAYISFFPQLVAGPIERAHDLLPQFLSDRHFDAARATDGLRQMLWGFFKKMVVADNCAIAVDQIWAQHNHLGSVTLIIGAILFTFQIYGDFSGYSDIAIGCARLFGINLSRNFHYPYFATNIRDFWRLWHISLMRWFTLYVYIPLGGSRGSRFKHIRNIFVVFIVSGMWHGSSWTFIAWGAYHAILLSVYLLINDNIKNSSRLARCLQTVTTFTLVVIGWIIFRSSTPIDAAQFINSIFSFSSSYPEELQLPNLPRIIVSITTMLITEWYGRHSEHALHFSGNTLLARHGAIRSMVYVALIMAICVFAGTQSQFIYFQF